jgi:MATE family multidrug resistance protein
MNFYFSLRHRAELKTTLGIAMPIIISNLAQISLGLIDSAMVGNISYRHLAASSLVINVISIPQVVCIGMAIGILPLVGIARGKRDPVGCSRYLFNGVWMGIITSALIGAACILFSPGLASMGQDPSIVPLAIPYFIVMAASLLPMTIFLSLKNFSDALEYTRTGMLVALLSIPLNAFLNWIFIYGHFGIPRLELLGAGIATLLTRIIMALAMGWLILREAVYRPFIQVRKAAWKLSRHTQKELLHLGIPSGIQLVMEAAAFGVSGVMIGWLGAIPQAAHQIALNLASTTFMAVVGLSMAGSIRVAHAYGANQWAQVKRIGESTAMGGLLYGLFAASVFILCRHLLPFLFNNEPEVVRLAADLLVVAALFQASDSLQSIGAGLCRGIKDVKLPTLLVTLAYWVIGIPIGYLLAFEWDWKAKGIWWGFVIGLTMAAFLLNRRFRLHVGRLNATMAP